MAIEYKSQDYTTGKQILVFPDHYVGVAKTFARNDTAAATIDGRKIIKAGTIYPSNDANAIGVVFYDVDVTDGDQNGTLIVHGFIKKAALPANPSANAKSALKAIQFFPLEAVTTTIETDGITIANAEAKDKVHTVRVYIAGAHFRPEAATLANWTFVGETTTKTVVDNIIVSGDGTYVDITTKNSAATAEGTVTAIPAAAATSTGDVPAAAITIVTVPAAAGQ